VTDASTWIEALRTSHERLRGLLDGLDTDQLAGPSYATEWSIAQVASHLGSGAEIFDGALQAALRGEPAPGNESFAPIWDRWNALSPAEQAQQSVAFNESFVSHLERVPEGDRSDFAMSMFGMDLDLAKLASLRLGEHAVHTWDVAVALDPRATLSADAVELLVDVISSTASYTAKPTAGIGRVEVVTIEPERRFIVDVGPDVVTFEAVERHDGEPGVDAVVLPAESLIRLVYGRLDHDHTPSGITNAARLIQMRAVFPGF
jgi:uncharacterized protein (TIGR03083 family)